MHSPGLISNLSNKFTTGVIYVYLLRDGLNSCLNPVIHPVQALWTLVASCTDSYINIII